MTALLTLTTPDGVVRRCDKNCYDARTPRCTCICGGINHGQGFRTAVENTWTLKQHPERVRYPKPYDPAKSFLQFAKAVNYTDQLYLFEDPDVDTTPRPAPAGS